MTKKDYELVARVLRNHIALVAPSADGTDALTDVAETLADEFERDNPRFDRACFLKAALG